MGEPNDRSAAAGHGVTRNPSVWWGLLYVAALWAGIRLAYLINLDDGTMTVIWVPTGVVVGALLVTRRWVWPALLAVSTGVYVLDGLVWPDMGWSWGQLLLIGVVTDLWRLFAAVLLLAWSPRAIRLEEPADLARLFAVVLGVFLLAAATSVGLWSRWEPGLELWREVQLWWFSDALGCVVLVCWVLAFFGPVPADPASRRRHHVLEAVGVWGLLALTCFTLVRLTDEAQPLLQRPYLVYPVLMWGGLRLGLRCNATALLLFSALLTVILAGDLGPFATGHSGPVPPQTAAVALQLFLLVTSFAVLVLAVVRSRGRRTEAELRAKHNEMCVLTDTLRPAVWMMDLPSKELVYVSPAFEGMTGRSPASMLGRPGVWRNIVHPDDRVVTEASLTRMVEKGGDDTEYRIVRTDGEVRWVRELSASVTGPEGEALQLVGSIEDVTHRHRAAEQEQFLQRELRESSERYRNFLRVTSEGVWRATFDPPPAIALPFPEFLAHGAQHGRLAECSDAFAAMYGFDSAAAAVGTPLGELFKTGDTFNQEYIARFHADGCRSLVNESRRIEADGRVRWFIATFAGVVEKGNLVALWGTLTETTEMRRLEDQIRETHKMEAVGQLAGGVAHDFNNLLAVISAHAELVDDQVGDDEQVAKSLGVVREAIEHASGVSRSLLAFGKKLPSERKPIDPADVIRQTQRMIARALPQTIELEIDLPDGGLPTVMGDAVQLQQVLLNLALNARDAMPEAGGRIVIAAEPCGTPQGPGGDGEPGAAGVRIAVQDEGVGMEEAVRRQVFEPFFTTKGETGGTGLGLAVAHGIVEHHGGTIAVHSRPGRGTTLTIELPGTQSVLPEPAGAAAPTPAERAAAAAAPVLLAEDDAQIRAVLATALESRGHRVVQAEDGPALRRAYDEMTGRGQRIAVLITDIDMPGRKGIDVLRELRRGGDTTPAVVITGSVEMRADPELDGDTVLVKKPFSIARLCEVVQEQIRHGGGQRREPSEA